MDRCASGVVSDLEWEASLSEAADEARLPSSSLPAVGGFAEDGCSVLPAGVLADCSSLWFPSAECGLGLMAVAGSIWDPREPRLN